MLTPIDYNAYVPLVLNVALWILGFIALVASGLALAKKREKWFVLLPVLLWAMHFVVFYSFAIWQGIFGYVVGHDVMTFWSAVLRFQGITAILFCLYIMLTYYGRRTRER